MIAAARPTDWKPDLVMAHVAKSDGCWAWTGMVNDAGYGVLGRNDRRYRAHRAVYEIHVGPIPDGMELDHLCRNRDCVRPDHLEAVSHRENQVRGEGRAGRARATHCQHGHAFSDANTAWENGRRRCRTCRREQKPSRLIRARTDPTRYSEERRRHISEAKIAANTLRRRGGLSLTPWARERLTAEDETALRTRSETLGVALGAIYSSRHHWWTVRAERGARKVELRAAGPLAPILAGVLDDYEASHA